MLALSWRYLYHAPPLAAPFASSRLSSVALGCHLSRVATPFHGCPLPCHTPQARVVRQWLFQPCLQARCQRFPWLGLMWCPRLCTSALKGRLLSCRRLSLRPPPYAVNIDFVSAFAAASSLPGLCTPTPVNSHRLRTVIHAAFSRLPPPTRHRRLSPSRPCWRLRPHPRKVNVSHASAFTVPSPEGRLFSWPYRRLQALLLRPRFHTPTTEWRRYRTLSSPRRRSQLHPPPEDQFLSCVRVGIYHPPHPLCPPLGMSMPDASIFPACTSGFTAGPPAPLSVQRERFSQMHWHSQPHPLICVCQWPGQGLASLVCQFHSFLL